MVDCGKGRLPRDSMVGGPGLQEVRPDEEMTLGHWGRLLEGMERHRCISPSSLLAGLPLIPVPVTI